MIGGARRIAARLWPPVPAGAAGDHALVRRAALVIAVQLAVAVALVVAVGGLLALSLTTQAQHQAIDTEVRQAAAGGHEVTDPPPGVVLVERAPDGTITVTPHAPPGLAAALNPDHMRPGRTGFDAGHEHRYAVYTADHPDHSRTVAALDLHPRDEERDRLQAGLAVAGGFGICAAAVIGWLVARRAVRPLGSALALQRRFVADASHELRTPLTILHTRAQMLQQRGTSDPQVQSGLDKLVAGTRELSDIVSDLLLSAELQSRRGDREQADLAALAHAVVDDFAPAAARDEVRLAADAPAPVQVAGVPVALRRALSALVDNALGHTGPGGTVTVTVSRTDQVASISVTDDGEGIDPDRAAELTERFARGPAAAGHGRRFGLGLALVREVVHAHGGTLTLDGRPGLGTTASITIPVAHRS
ncbi:MAG: signal transduction histidine kinase [Actinomycetia bacterium]|nr:signal transduction histidine kinase [Actinomycetes bacterium]